MVPVSIFSVVFLKNSGQKKFGHIFRKKNIIGRSLTSVLNSIFNIGGYRKEIQNRTRNKTVPVTIVSVMCLKNSKQKTFATRI